MRLSKLVVLLLVGTSLLGSRTASAAGEDDELIQLLEQAGFTGRVQASLEQRLGRRLNPRLATLGRDIFFDSVIALHEDNSCAGCHSPANGFGDSQSIAIGVDNNGIVGPRRKGPRNQRRSPSIINTAFYPKLMWNGRFFAVSGDPFDNSEGFTFPQPEGTTEFPPHDTEIKHLLTAQAHLPSTELPETAGFTGTRGTISPDFDQFDNDKGGPVPLPDMSGFRNGPIREAVSAQINTMPEYRRRFGEIFPGVAAGEPISFLQIAQAIAEFEFSMTFADAPIDRFARGDHSAMTLPEKRGAILFFGRSGCVNCHAVGDRSNEMFSDFENHVLGVPQIAPTFGVGKGNVMFDGPGANEDFGLEQVTGNPDDRYKFRTSPLRNLALQATFFHNGAFKELKDALKYHLDVLGSALGYDPSAAKIDEDLRHSLGPSEPVLDRLDPLMRQPQDLSSSEFEDLVAFLRRGLLDPNARPERLCRLVPLAIPSGRPVAVFEHCGGRREDPAQ